MNSSSTLILPASARLADQVLRERDEPVHILDGETLSDLLEERGAFGYLVHTRREPFQPPAPTLLPHWATFLGFLSSSNTREVEHAHPTVAEIYGVRRGRMIVSVRVRGELIPFELDEGSFCVIKPGVYHLVSWAGHEWGEGFAFKAPNPDPTDPDAKIVRP
jgi:mannose-6-phosphate isomerase-like protein (cupin superfamily)